MDFVLGDYHNRWTNFWGAGHRTPARTLRIISVVLFFLSILALVGNCLFFFQGAGAKPTGRVIVVATFVVVMISILKYAAIERCAVKMDELKSYKLAVTGAVLSLFDILLLPFGIWALVVLFREETKNVFNHHRMGT